MYMDLVATLFKCNAFYYFDENANFKIKLLNYLHRFLAIFSIFFMLFSSIYELVTLEEFTLLGRPISIFLSIGIYLSIIVRLRYFFMNDKEALVLMNKMKLVFRYESDTGIGKEQTMSGFEKIAKKLCVFWVIFDTSSIFYLPVVAVATLIVSGKTNPFGGEFPYDWTKPINYEITLTLQTISSYTTAAAAFTIDLFFMVSLLLTSGQLKILAWEVKHILYTSLLNYGISKENVLEFKDLVENDRDASTDKLYGEILDIIYTPKFQICIRDYIETCIQRHISFLQYFDELEGFIGPIWLILLGFQEFFLTLVIFTLIKTEDVSVFANMIFYLIFCLQSIFYYSLFPQILTNAAEHYLKSLCEYHWYYCVDRKATLNYLFILAKSQRILVVRAGFFIDMGIGVFVTVVKTSISYLGVLRTMSED